MIVAVVELLEVAVEQEGVGLQQLYLVEEGVGELKLQLKEKMTKMDAQLEGAEAQ